MVRHRGFHALLLGQRRTCCRAGLEARAAAAFPRARSVPTCADASEADLLRKVSRAFLECSRWALATASLVADRVDLVLLLSGLLPFASSRPPRGVCASPPIAASVRANLAGFSPNLERGHLHHRRLVASASSSSPLARCRPQRRFWLVQLLPLPLEPLFSALMTCSVICFALALVLFISFLARTAKRCSFVSAASLALLTYSTGGASAQGGGG